MTRLIDTNVFIHHLVAPVGDVGRTEHDASRELIRRVAQGDETLETTEACLAEVFFILTKKHGLQRSVSESVTALRGIVGQRGIQVRRVGLYREALDILDRHPRLGFEDALLAAHALDSGMPIVSYDREFDRVAGVTREEPSLPDTT